MPDQKPHIFFFFGDDNFSIREKVVLWKQEFIRKHGNSTLWTLTDNDGVQNEMLAEKLRVALRSASLFASPQLTIIQNVKDFPKPIIDTLIESLPRVSPTHFIVLTDTSLGVRHPLYKIFKECEKAGHAESAEFTTPRGKTLNAWIEKRIIKKGYTISADALATLCGVFEHNPSSYADSPDLAGVDTEIQKLLSYVPTKHISKQSVEAIIAHTEKGRIFDLTDAILAGKTQEMFRIHESLQESHKQRGKQSLIGTVSYLTKEFRNLLLLRGLMEQKPQSDPAPILGWSPQRISFAKKKIRALSFQTLRRIYLDILKCEKELKSSSLNPDGICDVTLYKAVTAQHD